MTGDSLLSSVTADVAKTVVSYFAPVKAVIREVSQAVVRETAVKQARETEDATEIARD